MWNRSNFERQQCVAVVAAVCSTPNRTDLNLHVWAVFVKERTANANMDFFFFQPKNENTVVFPGNISRLMAFKCRAYQL